RQLLGRVTAMMARESYDVHRLHVIKAPTTLMTKPMDASMRRSSNGHGTVSRVSNALRTGRLRVEVGADSGFSTWPVGDSLRETSGLRGDFAQTEHKPPHSFDDWLHAEVVPIQQGVGKPGLEDIEAIRDAGGLGPSPLVAEESTEKLIVAQPPLVHQTLELHRFQQRPRRTARECGIVDDLGREVGIEMDEGDGRGDRSLSHSQNQYA